MTQTRKEALEALLEKVEAGEWDGRDVWPLNFTTLCCAALGTTDRTDVSIDLIADAYDGSLDAAKALVESTLPGWGWRMAECSVSDDAWVFPDFNCPEHGPRLRATLDESMDWCAITDVDQRPAGNPARALLRSALIALIAQEETRND